MSNIDPSKKQFNEFKSLPRDTTIMMLNLIQLNDKARYQDGKSMSGKEAYANYGKLSQPVFARVGGKIIWRGKPECVLIGPKGENWDIAFIAEYPNAAAFLEMVTDPEYQAIVFHRQAAVSDSRLIRMGQSEDKTGSFF
ncbi:MAG: DUF1330 domain-containing protein [Gammaproteobacteria bacterium]|nr:DUF1330 domain-containing protein [Gammaproteobacteria bacterium]